MKNKIDPLALVFFIFSIFFMFLGILSNFEFKTLNLIVVIGNAFIGLILQWRA